MSYRIKVEGGKVEESDRGYLILSGATIYTDCDETMDVVEFTDRVFKMYGYDLAPYMEPEDDEVVFFQGVQFRSNPSPRAIFRNVNFVGKPKSWFTPLENK